MGPHSIAAIYTEQQMVDHPLLIRIGSFSISTRLIALKTLAGKRKIKQGKKLKPRYTTE